MSNYFRTRPFLEPVEYVLLTCIPICVCINYHKFYSSCFSREITTYDLLRFTIRIYVSVYNYTIVYHSVGERIVLSVLWSICCFSIMCREASYWSCHFGGNTHLSILSFQFLILTSQFLYSFFLSSNHHISHHISIFNSKDSHLTSKFSILASLFWIFSSDSSLLKSNYLFLSSYFSNLHSQFSLLTSYQKWSEICGIRNKNIRTEKLKVRISEEWGRRIKNLRITSES